MSTTTTERPVAPYAESHERFLADTREHEMTVLRDDGLYRHLRFKAPGSSFYWFDLVTWPGVLAFSGDVGCWVFSRTSDMFEFFEGPYGGLINPDYWSQKLRAIDGRDGAGNGRGRRYSPEAFDRALRQWALGEAGGDYWGGWGGHDLIYPSLLVGALEREVFDTWCSEYGDYHTEEQARGALERMAEDDLISWDDLTEMDLREWDWSFLWCCWAIVEGIKRYRAHEATAADEDLNHG